MPRYVTENSEDEYEQKTVAPPAANRRTRAILAAPVTESPIRRSTRIRHGSVNPDGSSPESVTGSTSQPVIRTTRRRAAEMATATPLEGTRVLRSRKNSNSSSISEQIESEPAVGTAMKKSGKPSSLNNSPNTPKPATRTRRSVRASSETKSPPPVARVTRRTRANSIEPEPAIERVVKAAAPAPSTPTRRRRTQVSLLPTEPVVLEETIEDKTEENEADDALGTIKEINSEKSSTSSAPKSSPIKDYSSNVEMEVDKSSEAEMSSPMNKSMRDHEVFEVLRKNQKEDVSPSKMETDDSSKSEEIFITKPRRNSLDKSKDLGKKIENLLNKSSEDLEESPRDKENQKLSNISPDKPRVNFEYTVSNVNIIRGKSLGSTQFVNKSDKKRANTSLDEQVLSKLGHNIAVSKLMAKEELTVADESEPRELGSFENSRKSNSAQKTVQHESLGDVKSPEKSLNESATEKRVTKLGEEEAAKNDESERSSRSKSELFKLDDTYIDNEVIEEFTLRDSEGSKSDSSKSRVGDSEESDSNDYIFEKHSPNKAAIKNDGDGDKKAIVPIRKMTLTLERISPQRKSDVANTSPRKKQDEQLKNDADSVPMESDPEEEKTECKPANPSPEKHEKESFNPRVESLSDINSKRDAAEEKSVDADDEEEETETRSVEKMSPKAKGDKNQPTRTDHSNQISDSDSSLMIDHLFQDISAEEWNKRRKSQESAKGRKSDGKEAKSQVAETGIDSAEETDVADDELGRKNGAKHEDGNDSTDSNETIILEEKDRPISVKGQRKPPEETIVEEREEKSSDEETAELSTSRKSPKKFEETRESKLEEEEIEKADTAARKDEEEEMEVDFSDAEAANASLIDKDCGVSKETETEEDDVEEFKASPKKTPKSDKKKSPIKSANKSRDVYDFDDFSDSEEKETKAPVKPKENLLVTRSLREPLKNNYSIVAVADSESELDGNLSEEESDDSKQARLPKFLLDAETSEEENEDEERPEKSNNTIDSDIAREMNLAGDSDVKYSDDEVPGDECRASETEQSDEEDDGSDLGDFLVADDAVESSEYSDEQEEEEEEKETPTKSKFKRIIDKSSSEEEEGEKEVEILPEENRDDDEEEEEKEDEEVVAKKSEEKSKRRMSLGAETVKIASAYKRLNKSADLSKSSSDKKVKKFELEEIENAASLRLEFGSSGRKFKKFSGSVSAALDTTVDLCTPEQEKEEEEEEEEEEEVESEEGEIVSPSFLDASNPLRARKSLDKLKKKLVEELAVSTPDKTETRKSSGISSSATTTPKMETPNRASKGSKEKTPKSVKKSQRDSLQIVAECVSATPTISSLNKTMLTPNSETPVTKFLKKERLNESLPLLELNRRSKRLSVGSTTNKMLEDQLEEDVSETEDREEAGESSNDAEEDDAREDVRENGDELNGVNEDSDEEEEQEEDEPRKSEEEDRDDDKDEEKEEEEEEEAAESAAELDSEEEIEKEEDESDNDDVFQVEIVRKKDSSFIERQEKSSKRRSKAEAVEKEEESEEEEAVDTKLKKKKDSPEKQEKSPKRKRKTAAEDGEGTPTRAKIGSTPKNRERSNNDGEIKEGSSLNLNKKRLLSNSTSMATTLERKKRARLETSGTPQSTKEMKKPKRITIEAKESDSDDAPESVGFSEARGAALQAMKDVASSLKAAKEAKKKKRKDHQARIRAEREAKLASASTSSSQSKAKRTLKRLPDDFLEGLSDVSQRPKKKLKLTKNMEQIMPSTSSIEPGKPTKSSIVVEKHASPLSSAGSTTLFSVVNLQKVKKKTAKNPAPVASFRERMLARNPRQPVSAFLVYQAKKKASGFHNLPNRK